MIKNGLNAPEVFQAIWNAWKSYRKARAESPVCSCSHQRMDHCICGTGVGHGGQCCSKCGCGKFEGKQ